MLICSCDLDLDPKTLIHELYLIILKMYYVRSENELSGPWSRSRLWKSEHYRQTRTTVNTTRPQSRVVINEEQNSDVQVGVFTAPRHAAALVYVCACVLRALAIIVPRLVALRSRWSDMMLFQQPRLLVMRCVADEQPQWLRSSEKLENAAVAITSCQSFSAVFATFVLCVRTSCCFSVSDQNSGIAFKFSCSNFLKDSNNLAIRWRSRAVTLTFDHLTLKVYSTSDVTWSKFVPNFSEIE